MKQKNDSKIKDLLDKVAAQKAKMGAKPRATLNTNGVFKKSESDFVNINTIRSKDVIIDYVSFLLQKEEYAQKACTLLGVPFTSPSISSFTVKDWIEDFKLRLDILNWEEENKKLEALKTKLVGLVSEETKTEMELNDIESLLK
jgi:hypothetical protein